MSWEGVTVMDREYALLPSSVDLPSKRIGGAAEAPHYARPKITLACTITCAIQCTKYILNEVQYAKTKN